MRVLTWYWKQTPNRAGYDADKVNRWIDQVQRHLTIPHTIGVVTDHPEGIDSRAAIIPLPRDFDGLKVGTWSEASGMPQCYRRLRLFAPDAGAYFGDDDIVSMDLDVLIVGSMDPLFSEPAEFRMYAGTSKERPYNGSMVRIRSGARRQVWDRFAADPAGVGAAARKLYIGSDQAVISMVLGKGERTWGEREGVHHYSPKKFERIHSLRSPAPPPGMRMLFFPGNVKPWDREAQRAPWIATAWQGTAGVTPVHNPGRALRLRAYDDPKGWGKAFSDAAAERRIFCSLFHRPRMVPTGIAFVRLDQQGPQRAVSRGIVHELNRQGIATLPTGREALWYDDKAAQLPVLRPWMPTTVHHTDPAAARAWLAKRTTFPLVSKSIDGSGSKGVRLLHTREEAEAELAAAFKLPGIPSVYGRHQFGYVYWQQFIADQPCDYRVCVVGRYVYGLVRKVRPGDFRASGSGIAEPLTLTTARERAAAALAVEISDSIGTDWMAYDIVFAEDGQPLVLEMSSAWTMSAYRNAPCFSRQGLAVTPRTGADSFHIAVEVCEEMARKG